MGGVRWLWGWPPVRRVVRGCWVLPRWENPGGSPMWVPHGGITLTVSQTRWVFP